MHRRLLSAGVVVASMLLALTAPGVAAVPPDHGPVDFQADWSTVDLCPFEITAHSQVTGRFTAFYDASGNLVKWIEQDVEQDTFSHGGKTLVGEPYRFVAEFRFDAEGNLVSYVATGGVERVVLPDGSLFWSVGRYVWTDHPGVQFTITPDRGHSGNVDAFCAALE